MAAPAWSCRASVVAHELEARRSAHLQARRSPRLGFLVWHSTHGCNYRCRHCFVDAGDRAGDLTTDEARRVFDNVARGVAPDGVRIGITGGEPTLRRDLPVLLRHLTSLGFVEPGLASNGYLLGLHPERMDELVAAGLKQLNLSLDGPPEHHNALRRHPRAYELARRALQHALEQHPSLGLALTVTVGPANAESFTHVLELGESLALPMVKVVLVQPYGRARSNPGLTGDDGLLVRVLDEVSRRRRAFDAGRARTLVTMTDDGFLGCYEGSARAGLFHCPAGLEVAGILHDGTLVGCPQIQQPFNLQGNLLRDDFGRSWREGFRAFRTRGWLKQGSCRRCAEWTYCQGGSLHDRGPQGELLRCNGRRIRSIVEHGGHTPDLGATEGLRTSRQLELLPSAGGTVVRHAAREGGVLLSEAVLRTLEARWDGPGSTPLPRGALEALQALGILVEEARHGDDLRATAEWLRASWRRVGTTARPRIGLVEVTSRCVGACPACPRSLMRREPTDMDVRLFPVLVRRLVDAAGPVLAGGERWPIQLAGQGEAVLHPRLPELVGLLAGAGFSTVLRLSGHVRDVERVLACGRAGLSEAQVLVDGTTDAARTTRRGSVSSLEQVERLVHDLVARLSHAGLATRVTCRMAGTSSLQGSVEEFRARWREVGAVVEPYRGTPDVFGPLDETNLLQARPRVCGRPWVGPHAVLADGRLVACGVDREGDTSWGRVGEPDALLGPAREVARDRALQAMLGRDAGHVCGRCRRHWHHGS